MSTLSVRVSEDPARPLGHAIVTLNGLPPGLETFEFALTRHGFTASHLGPDGWQGAECWLQPDEVWYAGDALKFVVPPELAFQLENMPYRLAARGQGLAGTMTVTFAWPLELDLEEGSASGERRVVGGTRVEAGPKPRPAAEPPPLPEVGGVVVDIPDVLIPEIGSDLEPLDERLPTRVTPPQTGASKPAGEDQKTPPAVQSDPRSSVPDSTVSPGPDSTHEMSGGVVPPVRPDRETAAEAAAPAPPELEPVREEPTRILSPQLEPGSEARPAEGAGAVGQRRRWVSGLLAGLLGLAVLAAGWWWWFGHRASQAPPVAPAPSTVPSSDVAPEPVPAPEPAPAPEPVPVPEPVAPIQPEPPVSQPVAPAPKPVEPVRPEPPAPQPVAPAPKLVEPVRPVAPEPVIPSVRPDSDRGLEEELKSEFDPTLQELEKRLRGEKAP